MFNWDVGSFGAVYLCDHVESGVRKAVKVFFHGDEKVPVLLMNLYITYVFLSARTIKRSRH
jgi:hypothetical protein